MSAILYSSQRFEVVLATGEVLVVGAVDNRKTLTLTNGLAYQTHDTIADNYGKDVLWATGQGGLDSFELMLFYSDADVWVEFNDDSGDAADFAVRLCKAGVWYVFPSYRLGINDDTVFDGAVLVEDTDYDDIQQIEVCRSVAEGEGDANVRLILLS